MTIFARRLISAGAGLLCGALLAAAASAASSGCPIPTSRIAEAIGALDRVAGVSEAGDVDPRSEEPIIRTLALYDDGAAILLEQKNCHMLNLRITLLGQGERPDAGALARLGAALGATPLWAESFQGQDAAATVSAVFSDSALLERLEADGAIGLDDRFPTAADTREAAASFMADPSDLAQFGYALTLYLGIGGL